MPDSDGVSLADARGRRTHPLSFVIQGVTYGAAAAIAAIVGSLGNFDNILVIVIVIIGAGAFLVGFAAGFVHWWFTRYVIDDTETRIHTGAIFKGSRRIPFERLQSVDIAEPLIARIFGLAELRLEMAGGGESRTGLRYLPLDDARALRRVLLERAHGRATDADVRRAGAAEDDFSDFTLQGKNRGLICRVPPRRVIGAAFLSLDLLGLTLGLIAIVVIAFTVATPELIAANFPIGLGWLQFVSRRVIQQWDFQLSDSERGLRIQRGLLTRSSQTLPFDRIQGVSSVEPLVWRQLGWQRVDVDVAGYAEASESSSDKPSDTLLPVADHALFSRVVEQVIPAATDAYAQWICVPGRSWWFAPIGWRFRYLGIGLSNVYSRTGWITRRTSIVPHHKTQSVSIRQGPLQRLRRIATLDVHTPDGPVDARVRHLDSQDARREALRQLTRARQARI